MVNRLLLTTDKPASNNNQKVHCWGPIARVEKQLINKQCNLRSKTKDNSSQKKVIVDEVIDSLVLSKNNYAGIDLALIVITDYVMSNKNSRSRS